MKPLLSVLLSVILIFSFILPHDVSQAQTASEQQQITVLLALIIQLQQQLALLTGQGTCTVFTQNLYIGLYDYQTGNQVSKLQAFLKAQGDFTHPTITGFFGVVTQKAVQKFQARMGIVSQGAPASTGYGFVGPGTRTKIQAVSCAAPGGGVVAITQPAVLPQQLPVVPPPAVPAVLPGNISVSCNPSISSVAVGQTITWTATVSGANLYNFSWSGTNGLSGNAQSVSKTYTSSGTKSATVTVNGNSVSCASTVIVTGALEVPPEEEGEEIVLTDKECSDGIDNDNDNLIDYPYEIGCSSANDDNEENDEVLAITQKFYPSTWEENDAEDLGAQKEIIVYGLDLNKNNVVDSSEFTTLKNKINSQIPNEDASGYAVIDEEGPMLSNLKKLANDPLFIQAQEQLVLAINFAKDLRPNMKWGFYSVPNFPYWVNVPGGGVTKSWAWASQVNKDLENADVFKITNLLDAVDIYAPSLYPHYEGISVHDIANSENAVEQSLIHGAGKKPVIPYYTHRYYNGNAPYAHKLLPWDEFQAELETIMDAGAHGVFWWGADSLIYGNALADPNPSAGELILLNNYPLEFPGWVNEGNYDEYFNLLQIQYLKLMSEVMFGYDFEPQPIVFVPGSLGGDGLALTEPVENDFEYLAMLNNSDTQNDLYFAQDQELPAVPQSFFARMMGQMANIFVGFFSLFQ